MNNVIKFIYDNTINIVLKDINSEDIEEAKKGYIDYLHFHYDNKKDVNEHDRSLNIMAKVEGDSWRVIPLEDRKSLLLKDPSLDKLKFFLMSSKIYAKDRKDRSIIVINEEQVKNYIMQMHEELSKIRPFNINLAQKIVRESSDNFMYAAGLSNDKDKIK